MLAVVAATAHHIDQHKETDMGLFSKSEPERDANGDRKFGWDGTTPNTADEKRFYRNRESGYAGWIDQDGYRCDSNGKRTGGDS